MISGDMDEGKNEVSVKKEYGNDIDKNLKKIKKELEDLDNEYNKKKILLTKEISKLEAELIPQDERDLATFLHNLICIDRDCTWHYCEETNWKADEKIEFLKKARKLLEYTDKETLIKIFKIVL